MKMKIDVVLDHMHSISSYLVLAVRVPKPFYTGINYWNSLPSNIKEIKNEDLFKKKVKEHLMMEMEKEENDSYTK